MSHYSAIKKKKKIAKGRHTDINQLEIQGSERTLSGCRVTTISFQDSFKT